MSLSLAMHGEGSRSMKENYLQNDELERVQQTKPVLAIKKPVFSSSLGGEQIILLSNLCSVAVNLHVGFN